MNGDQSIGFRFTGSELSIYIFVAVTLRKEWEGTYLCQEIYATVKIFMLKGLCQETSYILR